MIAIILIIGFIVYFFISKSPKKKTCEGNQSEATPSKGPSEESSKDFSHAYQRKYLFSVNEKNEFRKLIAWASTRDLYVFPKVRLLDIIEPRNNTDNYKSLLWKIQAKHVDFVVCDRECRIKFLIELDDNSHGRPDRMARDEFVSQALCGAGYTVSHTRAITEEFLNSLISADISVVSGL